MLFQCRCFFRWMLICIQILDPFSNWKSHPWHLLWKVSDAALKWVPAWRYLLKTFPPGNNSNTQLPTPPASIHFKCISRREKLSLLSRKKYPPPPRRERHLGKRLFRYLFFFLLSAANRNPSPPLDIKQPLIASFPLSFCPLSAITQCIASPLLTWQQERAAHKRAWTLSCFFARPDPLRTWKRGGVEIGDRAGGEDMFHCLEFLRRKESRV